MEKKRGPGLLRPRVERRKKEERIPHKLTGKNRSKKGGESGGFVARPVQKKKQRQTWEKGEKKGAGGGQLLQNHYAKNHHARDKPRGPERKRGKGNNIV